MPDLLSLLGELDERLHGRLVVDQLLLDVGVESQVGQALGRPATEVAVLAGVDQETPTEKRLYLTFALKE